MIEIRSDRTGQGPVKLTAERQKYFELTSEGVSNSRVCAIVGVGERTGRAWRAGKPKEARARLRPRAGRGPRQWLMPRLLGPAGSRFLDLQERITIFIVLENKQGIHPGSAAAGMESLEMRVVHETIYQGLYRQGDAALRRELSECLRTGRAMRKSQRGVNQRIRRFFDPMIMINTRPVEIKDRAVAGH